MSTISSVYWETSLRHSLCTWNTSVRYVNNDDNDNNNTDYDDDDDDDDDADHNNDCDGDNNDCDRGGEAGAEDIQGVLNFLLVGLVLGKKVLTTVTLV